MRIGRVGATAVAVIASALGCGDAVAAPAQLLNRTVLLNWTTTNVQRGPDGQTTTRQLHFTRTIYISGNGRMFDRSTRTAGRRKGVSEFAPGDKQLKTGEAAGLRFSGDRIVGNVAFATGAAQFVVSFGGGFSTCSVDISLGREGGQMRRRGVDGKMYDILSSSVSGQSCSIREGNLLAG